MEVKTILWPTDLSENSKKAAKAVVSLAQKYGAEVKLMYVAADLCQYFPAYGNHPQPERVTEFLDWELEHAKKKLDTICETELDGCPMLSVKLVSGDAATEILKAVKEEKADLVVLTRKGHGGPGLEGGFGSVAEKVLKNSPVPVHVVT